MMFLNRPSSAARTAVLYITIGVLTDVWSGIWYWYLTRHPPTNDVTWFWCYGFLLSGLALAIIGLAIGQIGRSARHAELPPQELVVPSARTDQQAASQPATVATPVNAAGQLLTTNGQSPAPATGAQVPVAIPADPAKIK
jgi:hypothetical protein